MRRILEKWDSSVSCFMVCLTTFRLLLISGTWRPWLLTSDLVMTFLISFLIYCHSFVLLYFSEQTRLYCNNKGTMKFQWHHTWASNSLMSNLVQCVLLHMGFRDWSWQRLHYVGFLWLKERKKVTTSSPWGFYLSPEVTQASCAPI